MVDVNFEFTGKNNVVIASKIKIPVTEHPNEIGCRIIKQNRIPFYSRQDILQELQKFCDSETEKYYDSDDRLQCDMNEEQLIDKWSEMFTEEWGAYAKRDLTENNEAPSFADMYHSLIHSPALETMLNLERTRALFIEDLVRDRDDSLAQIQRRQSEEMEEAVAKVSISVTDKEINDLAALHFQESQKVSEDWNNKIGDLKKIQKKEFQEWVTKVYEDYKSGSLQLSNPVYDQTDDSLTNEVAWVPQQKKLEESFTIHLGSQLKVTHNLRLLSTDVLDFCRHKSGSENLVLQPQRVQTAMSLYSNSLSGLVLLVDNRINSYTGIKREFANICLKSTELHFADLEEQMSHIETLASQSSRAKKRESSGRGNKSASTFLKPGDFYITRHSNLSEVHVVFHLVADDTLLSSDINSRHPVILGLRQILRVAHEWDVCALSLPLLLAQEMAEEMTIPWCLKRAELVFKCIKGFMIEMASLTGEDTRTVQFIVPKGISEDFFSSLLTMLPGIFRVSNPLVLKSR